MSVAAREIEQDLRHAAAAAAVAGMAYGVRDWASDMAAAAPAIPATDAFPALPALGPLLEPLAGSALEGIAFPQADLAPRAPEATAARALAMRGEASVARGALSSPRFAIPAERARADGVDLPPAGSAEPVAAHVAALLARHAHLRPIEADAQPRRADPHTAPAGARKVVPMTRRRAASAEPPAPGRMEFRATDRNDAAPPPGRAPGAQPSRLVQWHAAAIAAGVRSAAAVPAAGTEQGRAALGPGFLPTSDIAAASPYAPVAGHDRAPFVRLADLLRTAAATPARPAAAAPDAAAEAAPAERAAALPIERAALGRVADTLARIEERLAADRPQGESAPRWLDDDDGLAARIHGILRREVERHGIEAR